MKTNTRENIFEYIKNNQPVSVKNIVDKFWISAQIVHRHIKILILEDRIYKVWKSPKVYYFVRENNIEVDSEWKFVSDIKNEEVNDIISKDKNFKIFHNNFVNFSPDWDIAYDSEWFIKWCQKRWLKPEKEIDFYKKTIEKYNKFKTSYWLIKWIDKVKDTFKDVYLDKIYYLDFYSIEKYWKTYLWNLMFYAKQTWDMELTAKILDSIIKSINQLIEKKDIDAIAFIPPSIDRKTQLMTEIEKWLNLKLPKLKLIKLFKEKVVAQKSLSKKEDRIINARDTIFTLDKNFSSDNILIIDDAVWSWATLNETAKKIKQKWFAKKVIWLAIVWSYKWFEVINEV